MKNPISILIAASIVCVSFVGWRVYVTKNHTTNYFEVVEDPSRSFKGGCGSIIGTAEELLRNAGVSSDSTLTVLALGDQSTEDEPRRLAKYTIPTARKVVEGRRGTVEREERLLRDLQARCDSMPATLISPIYLGVKQAVADLRAAGCKEGSRCELLVSTDLEENGDAAIEERINGSRGLKAPLPEPLDNSGIAVKFCGLAETAGPAAGHSGRETRKAAARDPRHDDRLQAVWRSLFVHPEIISFEPYCPESSITLAHKAAETPGEER